MQKVSFDPGYYTCLDSISDNIELMYNAFVESFSPLKQKKFQFSVLLPKFNKIIEKNVSFYLGCLLWAVYLKNIKEGVIEDNPCFGNEYNKEDSIEEPNFILNLIETKLERDTKYYLNKPYTKNQKFITVLETYIEFICLNEGFIKIEKTKDIALPSSIKIPSEEKLVIIESKIKESIEKKNLLILFEVYDLILG